MTKSEQLTYLKRKFKSAEMVTDAILPVSKQDIHDEMGLMDSVREYELDKKTSKKALTSDE
jgi:hypothetical protein